MEQQSVQSKLDGIAKRSALLGKEDLRKVGYDLCYLNLLAAFGASRSPQEVEELALNCMRNYYRSSSHFAVLYGYDAAASDVTDALNATACAVDFKPGVLEAIEQLQQTSGVFVATHHWGGFRFLSLGLANRGKDVTVLIDRLTHDPASLQGKAGNQPWSITTHWKPVLHGYLEQRLRFVVAEEKTAIMRIHRTIANGNLVMMYPDGNTGWDGPKGHQGRTTLSFLGQRIRIKSGIAQMSLLLQAPIVVLTAEILPNGRVLVDLADVLIPPAVKTAAALDYPHDALKRIYAGLERCVLARPEQWESVRHLHRWREPSTEPKTVPPDSLQRQVLDSVRAGWHCAIDRTRMARVVMSARDVLVDVQTMCAYETNAETLQLLWGIVDHASFAAAWNQVSQDKATSASFVKLVALLYVRGLLKSAWPLGQLGLA